MKVLFVPVKWSDSIEQDVVSWNVDTVKWLASKTRAFYLENTYGKVDMDITVAQWLTIAVTKAQASLGAVANGANTELIKVGIDPSQYERRVYFSPSTTAFGWKGFNGGANSLVCNCMGSEYAIHSTLHELGHSFGIGHPQVLTLDARNGNVITVPPLSVKSGGVVTSLYDASTVMGYDFWSPNFSGPEKVAAGWVTPTTHLGGDVTYSLTPLATAGGACYVVKIPMTSYSSGSARSYWIERREDVGDGYWFKVPPDMRGIIIRVNGDFGCYSPALLVTAPGRAGSRQTCNLLPGESFTDGSIVIECIDPGTVRVHAVDAGTVPAPVYPPAGTFLGTLCRGVDQWGRYANGTGGEITTIIQTNSPACGYVAPAPVPPNNNAVIIGQLSGAVGGLSVSLQALVNLLSLLRAGTVTQAQINGLVIAYEAQIATYNAQLALAKQLVVDPALGAVL
jgi:hypothetical protein